MKNVAGRAPHHRRHPVVGGEGLRHSGQHRQRRQTRGLHHRAGRHHRGHRG